MAYLPENFISTFRIWKGGKIVTTKGLPPGRYTVKCLKVQVDWKGRLQHHWELQE